MGRTETLNPRAPDHDFCLLVGRSRAPDHDFRLVLGRLRLLVGGFGRLPELVDRGLQLLTLKLQGPQERDQGREPYDRIEHPAEVVAKLPPR